MSVYMYAMHSHEAFKRLQAAIASKINGTKMEIYRSIEAFSEKLRQPGFRIGRPIVVICAAGKDDLQQVISLKGLLDDTRIILILPNRKKNTIFMGHLLRPRFLTYADGNFGDVTSVLEKMRGDSVPAIESDANQGKRNGFIKEVD